MRRSSLGGIMLFAVTAFSCGPKPLPPLTVPEFDAARAFADLETQVAFGPRVPNSDAHAACLDFLKSTLDTLAEQVTLQSFDATIAKTGEKVRLTNVIASFGMDKKNRILLAAHWDTRPWADMESDPDKRNQPVPGANDGASGVAVLLEIARVLKANPAPVGVDIVLFDGEDFGSQGRDDTWAVGAQYFAGKKDVRYNPFLGILLDMIGDKDLQIKKEGNSLTFAPDVVDLVWNYAGRLGIEAFSHETIGPIMDDHVPLLQKGIPCIDLIDFDYPYWHTLEDTPDKCSPESLSAVGRVVLAVIYNPPL